MLFQGAHNGPVLEAVGVDVAAGNHEFDYGALPPWLPRSPPPC